MNKRGRAGWKSVKISDSPVSARVEARRAGTEGADLDLAPDVALAYYKDLSRQNMFQRVRRAAPESDYLFCTARF